MQIVTRPTNISNKTKLRVYIWGAGGAHEWRGNGGGYGGFTESIIDIQSSETIKILVGQGGTTIYNSGAGAYGGGGGGGGTAGQQNHTYHYAAGGGGRSAILIDDIEVLVAGGGGGGGEISRQGGNGGGLIGKDGTNNDGSALNLCGKGGTQTNGGAGGTGGWVNGGSGSKNNGGTARSYLDVLGSGGGGYYGGGGASDSTTDANAGAGGGGSGYVGKNGTSVLSGSEWGSLETYEDIVPRLDNSTLSRTLTYKNTKCIQSINSSHPKYVSGIGIPGYQANNGMVIIEFVNLST